MDQPIKPAIKLVVKCTSILLLGFSKPRKHQTGQGDRPAYVQGYSPGDDSSDQKDKVRIHTENLIKM